MTDRPIPLKGFEVRAFLDGRKSQLRRLAWKGKELRTREQFADDYIGSRFVVTRIGNGLISVRHPTIWQKVRPGDRLWATEKHSLLESAVPEIDEPGWEWTKLSLPENGVWYWVDGEPRRGDWTFPRSSTQMPRWASRLTLVVTETRRERVQEISEADARAEGVEPHLKDRLGTTEPGFEYRQGMAYSWNALHGKGAWARNDEVVVLTVTAHKGDLPGAGQDRG